ncbi:major facilitator superfamily MFS_1 [Beutenbergia cavernae DSM 12333]|uniref:Major facilitator superfamily MFS_1 n=1 Tax=Beutenbergia cavernae (strain ATCC BAA-8 / DSM 12333 / CCUG 43141 / JCM 11478 / NBRC 16432 / NCIMB 13614 / HKI 0122) TaxID=471853 RepID=C5BUU1_BEUC1|nr:MFS transporter [Beutenbergia cavernae]ACQ78315.1 major facilitator superfamily MFS_1 [Beutenbergia cavernae DSM 12333]
MTTPRFSGARSGAGLLLLAVLLCALNLRAAITALPPVVGDVSAELGLTAGQVGLLTGVPVLCFAVATPAASGALGRWGVSRCGTVALVAIAVGSLVRSVDGFAVALAGTVLIGLGITIGNVTLPFLIGRDFPSAVAMVTGLYTAALNVGTTLTTSLTAPLAGLTGWRFAIASWSLLAVVALAVWWRAFARRPAPEVPPPPAAGTPSSPPPQQGERSVLRLGITWLLAATFATQAFSFYGVTAWLPTLLRDTVGIPADSAGGAAAVFQVFAIVGGVGVPLALARRASIRAVALTMSAFWLTLPIGLLLRPESWAWWASIAGISQGGMFAVIFTLVAWRAPSQSASRRTSATVQTIGYSVAALAPPLLGVVHTGTDGWTAPLVVVLCALLAMTGCVAVASAAPSARGREKPA